MPLADTRASPNLSKKDPKTFSWHPRPGLGTSLVDRAVLPGTPTLASTFTQVLLPAHLCSVGRALSLV